MSVHVSLLSLVVATTMTSACATAGARPAAFPGAADPRPPVTPLAPPPGGDNVAATPAATPPLPGVEVAPTPVSPTSIPPASASSSPTNTTASARKADAVLIAALKLQGTRYRLGGESPASGFDCSGFVRYVFDQYQVELPRTVAEQFSAGKKVSPAEIQAGDLLFFATTAKSATHVGIALGPSNPGEFVHAPGAGGSVRVERFDTSYWSGKLLGVRRVF